MQPASMLMVITQVLHAASSAGTGTRRLAANGCGGAALRAEQRPKSLESRALLVLVVSGLIAQTACVSHEVDGPAKGAPQAGNSGGQSGREGAAGEPSEQSSSGTSSTAGVPSVRDLIDMAAAFALPMCDREPVSVSECGGTPCPALPETASATCTINCCSPAGTCGLRNTDVRVEQFIGNECAATAVVDPRCPSSSVLGVNLLGCCDPHGLCGQILGYTCVATGTRACDATPGTAADSDAGS